MRGEALESILKIDITEVKSGANLILKNLSTK